MQKIISYNVNGIRAAINKGLLDWMKTVKPGILCMQETKAQPDQVDMIRFKSDRSGKEEFIPENLSCKVPPSVKYGEIWGQTLSIYNNFGGFLRNSRVFLPKKMKAIGNQAGNV